MAKGLGFVEPQRTSPVDPKAPYTGPIIDPVNPNLRRRGGAMPNQKFSRRGAPYHWKMQMDMGYDGYRSGLRPRSQTPDAYTRDIER